MKDTDNYTERSKKIREQAKQALGEQPNSMIKYRLEMVLALSEEMIAASQVSVGESTPSDSNGSKEVTGRPKETRT